MENVVSKTNTACLNTVKFLGACIIAFFWHYQHFSPELERPFGHVFAFSYSNGWLIVELFFILSGFGMMLGYGNMVQSHQVTFGAYIKKRLIKIYPLFFTTLILVIILQLFYSAKMSETFVYSNNDLYHLFLNIILCQDGLFATDWSFNAPSWCVSICFILYIVFFAVFFYAKNIQSAVNMFIGIGLLGAYVLLSGWNYPILNELVARGFVGFAIGIILAYFYQYEHLFNTKLVGNLCLITLILFYIIYRTTPSFIGSIHMLFIICIAPMIVLCVLYVPWLNQLFSSCFAQYLGSLSMEIYLFHFNVQCLIKNIDIYCNLELNYSRKIVWIGYAALTILVAILYKQLLADRITRVFIKLSEKVMNKP